MALPAPDNILHEVPYRGRRIVLTDDRRLVGQQHPDKWGFAPDRGFVVLDEFDDHVFPAGIHWFYSPDEAALAIEMLDTVLPTIQRDQPATTLMYEYNLMRRYRTEFWHTYHALRLIENDCRDAAALDDNPREVVMQRVHLLRQQVAQGRSAT